jgi:hypothetical protein
MRKRFVFIAIITALIATLLPMRVAAQAWYLDLYAGWSYSDLTGKQSPLNNGSYKSGFAGGAGAELMLNEDWGWEFGLWYIQKGTKGLFQNNESNIGFLPGTDDVFDGTVSLDYVEIPILVNVYFPVGETARIRGFIGPTFSFLTRAEADGTFNGESGTEDIKDDFDDADITVMIGAGGQFKLQRVNILLDFRWDIGTTNISKVPDTEIRTSTIMVTLGVGIPLTSYDE